MLFNEGRNTNKGLTDVISTLLSFFSGFQEEEDLKTFDSVNSGRSFGNQYNINTIEPLNTSIGDASDDIMPKFGEDIDMEKFDF